MLHNKTYSKKQKSTVRWAFLVGVLYSLTFFSSYSASSEEILRNCLPSPPPTGTLDNLNSRPAGTRDNHCQSLCGQPGGQITYLLGNKNREYTESAHSTFWFHIPQNTNQVKQITFVLFEDGTGKKIYESSMKILNKTGFIGITIPLEEKYAISPNTTAMHYTWG